MNSGLQSTCRKGQTANREMDPIRTAKQSERWPVLREIWKVETCFCLQKFGFQESSTATTQGGQLVQLDYAASGQNFVDVWREAVQKLVAQSWQHCNRMERSWSTRKLELNIFYQVGFKKISLLVKSKLTGVNSDEVTPRSSTGHTLMGLHCIHWILKQNFRIQSQSPEQKLCYKARWFYGIVTSRPFTYFEPSASRSSGASLNRIVEIYVHVSSSWYLEPHETWHVIFVGFQLCLNWFGTINKHSHQWLSKASDSPKICMSVHMVLGQHICVGM